MVGLKSQIHTQCSSTPSNKLFPFTKYQHPLIRYWKASWSNGSQSILAPEVQCNSSRTSKFMTFNQTKKGKRKKPIFQHESHLVIQFYYDFAWLYALCCAFLRAASFFFPRFVKTMTVFLVFLKIDAALQEGVGVLKLLTSKGLTESARCFNTEQKYKHIRVQNMQT